MKKYTLLAVLIFTRVMAFSSCDDSLWMSRLGMKKIQHSPLAEYYAQEKDLNFVRQLDSALQANAERLFAKFNRRMAGPIRVQVFPERGVAECVCGGDSTQNGILACARYRKINMVSPQGKGVGDEYTHRNPCLVLLHEYAHCLTFEITGQEQLWKLPPWLREGIAIQSELEPRYKYPAPKAWVLKQVAAQNIPAAKQLCTRYHEVPQAQLWAAWFSEFLVQKYGWPTLLALLTNHTTFPKPLGLTYAQLNKEWVQYLRSKI